MEIYLQALLTLTLDGDVWWVPRSGRLIPEWKFRSGLLFVGGLRTGNSQVSESRFLQVMLLTML